MRTIITLIKRYKLTLLTLLLIFGLTFYKPTGLEPSSKLLAIDKAVHFLMYASLCAVFWYESFKVTLKPKMLWMLFFAVVVPICIGGVLELLQSAMTSYRTSEFGDFVYNSVGVLFAALFSLLVTRPLMKWKRKRRSQG